MRSNPAMLYPLLALVAWTLVVLALVPIARVRSVRQREIGPDELELPMLFYVVGIVLYVSGGASYVAMFVAWLYVALRIVDRLVQLTANELAHRRTAFTLSNLALVVLWVLAAVHLAGVWP